MVCSLNLQNEVIDNLKRKIPTSMYSHDKNNDLLQLLIATLIFLSQFLNKYLTIAALRVVFSIRNKSGVFSKHKIW